MFIFDLDHTVIDSSHRQITAVDGSLNLDAWRAACTKENIMRDSLLPLAAFWREMRLAGQTVIVCTARVMTRWDFHFLDVHGLKFDACLSRNGEQDNRKDHILKVDHLRVIPSVHEFVMFDDNDGVREAVSRELGVTCIHPRDFA